MAESTGALRIRKGYTGTAAASPSQTRIGFRCLPDLEWLLLAPGVSAQIAIDPRLTRIPHTRAWFRGAISLRGSLYPVFDLGAWLTGEPGAMDKARILVIEPGDSGAAVMFSDEPRLLQVRRASDQAAGSGRLAGFTSGLYRSADDLAIDFDHRKWFAHVGADVADR